MNLININHNYCDSKEIIRYLKIINNKLNNLNMNIQELTELVDSLQVSLDAEQEQIIIAIQGLTQQVQNLTDIIATGGTPEQLQMIADKINTIKTDLEGTIN